MHVTMEPLSRVLHSLNMLDEQTVVVQYCDAVKIGHDDMRELLDKLYAFTGKKPLKRLIVVTKNSSIDMPARLLLQEENKRNKGSIIAEAVVVNSLAQKMAVNFYLKFIKDSYPSKFFTDVRKAEEWLKQQS